MNCILASSTMIIYAVHIVFIVIMYGQTTSQSLNCITISSSDTVPNTVDCPDSSSTVSCGYRLDPASTTMDFGVLPSGQDLRGCEVIAQDLTVTAFVYATCCDLATYDTSCSLAFEFEQDAASNDPRPIDDTILNVACSDDFQLFACHQSGDPTLNIAPARRLSVVEVGVLGGYPLNSTQPPPQGMFDLDNTCTSHRTSFLDPNPTTGQSTGRIAVCCQTDMPDIFSFQCIGVSSGQEFWNGDHLFSIACPANSRYTMVSCHGYSPFNLVNGAFIDDVEGTDQCMVQRLNDQNDTHFSVATAICCQVNTPSPTESPTEITVNPTSNPTNNPIVDSSEEEEKDSNSNSESIEDALRINEKRDRINDKDDDKHKNENVEIKLGASLKILLFLIALCCLIAISGWVLAFKSIQSYHCNN